MYWKVMIVVLLALLAISAWGVSYQNAELTLKSGETYLYYTNIQNMEDNTKNVTISITGDKIAKPVMNNEFFIIQPKSKNPMYIEIKIPENPDKSRYEFTIYYTSNPFGSGIHLTTQKSVDVKVNVLKTTITQNGGYSGGSGYTSSQQNNTTNQTQPEQNQTIIELKDNTTTNTNIDTDGIEPSGDGVGVTITEPSQANYSIPIIFIVMIGIIGFLLYRFDIIEKVNWI